MPLLLLPVLLLLLAALALLLWPLALWQRYRLGRSRRRALPWLAAINAAGGAVSLPLFVLGAWVGSHWIDGALANALAGLCTGVALGALGLRLTRFEAGESQLHYTPNPWIVLALTVLVAVRVLLGAWQAWHRAWHGGAAPVPWPWMAGHASLLAMAGLLLGYYAAYAWGLHRRVRRRARRLDLRLRR